MQQDNQPRDVPLSLVEFMNTPAGREWLASADTAFGRVHLGTTASFLKARVSSMFHLKSGDDLALGELLEQICALQSTAESLNGFAVEFYRQSGGFAFIVDTIQQFCGHPTARNRARLLEAAAPLAGYHLRMSPRIRQLLRPFIKGPFWRRELLNYGKLFVAVHDHMKDGVIREDRPKEATLSSPVETAG